MTRGEPFMNVLQIDLVRGLVATLTWHVTPVYKCVHTIKVDEFYFFINNIASYFASSLMLADVGLSFISLLRLQFRHKLFKKEIFKQKNLYLNIINDPHIFD